MIKVLLIAVIAATGITLDVSLAKRGSALNGFLKDWRTPLVALCMLLIVWISDQ